MAARKTKPPAVEAKAPRKRRARVMMDDPQTFKFADGVKVTIEWPLPMPEWVPRFNLGVMAMGAAKGGEAPIMPSFAPQLGPLGRIGGGAEESRTNISNTFGMNMTRGTMDPAAAARDGIPGLTAREAEAVDSVLDRVESSVIDHELDSIEDLEPEDEVHVPDA